MTARAPSRARPGHPAPAGLGPITPLECGWADYDNHHGSRARYWWIGALGGVFVLATISVGVFWLVRGGSSEAPAGTRVSAYGLTYRLPPGWTTRPHAELPWARNMLAKGIGAGPEFDCGGQRRARAQSGVLLVYRTDGHPPTPSDAATALGRAFAHAIYGADASVTEAGRDGQATGLRGVSTRFAAVPATGSVCPIAGQVDVVALPGAKRGRGGQPTVRVFLLQHDTSGGPPQPAPPGPRDIRGVLASLRETTPPS